MWPDSKIKEKLQTIKGDVDEALQRLAFNPHLDETEIALISRASQDLNDLIWEFNLRNFSKKWK